MRCVLRRNPRTVSATSAHHLVFEPTRRHLHEHCTRLVMRQIIASRLFQRVHDGLCPHLRAFEPTLRVSADLASVGVPDPVVVILAGDTTWHDELEVDIMDIEEAREVELGEGGLDHRVRAHLIHAVIEAVDILEVEQVFGEVQESARLALADRPGRVVDAHEAVRPRPGGVLENMVEIPLVTEEMPHDADGERERLSGPIVPNLLRKAPPRRLKIGEQDARDYCANGWQNVFSIDWRLAARAEKELKISTRLASR
jgi:hypothetical protein